MEFADNKGQEAQPYKYNGKELDTKHGLNMYDYSARYYEPSIGRFRTVDPKAEKYYSISPYAYCYNNPLKYIDPTGKDSIQRNNAIAKAEEYVAKKEPGNQYQMGAKGKPGEKVDCSGLVSESVVAGGEKNPNYGNSGGGVKNIKKNTTKVSNEEVVKGNLVSFRSKSGYAYHIGIVKNIERNENGEITKVTYIHSSGGKGPNEATINTNLQKNTSIHGFYKWDRLPETPSPIALPKPQSTIPDFSLKNILKSK